jgi:hypothetical protein
MSTDLFGNPLGKPATFELSLHQRRQAALLHHWTSREYLEGLLTLIDGLMKGVDTNLSLAKIQGRDALIANAQWGVRDTAANWGSLAWPALEDFKLSTMRLLGWRSGNLYCGTGLTQCDRMLGELSPYWMTPDEKAWFDAQWAVIFDYAYRLDQAVGVGTRRPMNDREMAEQFASHAQQFLKMPVFRVRTDCEFDSGEMPDKTGVYVPVDDPSGTLQFAWTGSKDGALGKCQTLSEIGRKIVSRVGRDRMWIDGQAIADVVAPMYASGELATRSYGYDAGDELDPRWVSGAIGAPCLVERECKWYFVEKLDGQFENVGAGEGNTPTAAQGRLRCEAGQPCPRAGLWYSPAASEPMSFKQGDVMPEMTSDYGQTIWYLDRVVD